MKIKLVFATFALFFTVLVPGFAQVGEEEENWDMYDDLALVDDAKVKRFAKPTIVGMSPTRFLSLSYDRQLPYRMNLSAARFPASGNSGWGVEEAAPVSSTGDVTFTGGMRFTSTIPVISKANLVWQTGLNYARTGYSITAPTGQNKLSVLANSLNERGLNNLSWANTVFLPVSEQNFLIFQGSLDLSGDYDWSLQPLQTVRGSLAAIYGKRVNETKRWGVGLARTYRVGNLNYVPVILYDVTGSTRKWGAEILFPARAHGRYNFSKNSLLLFGYELEGQSYRIDAVSVGNNSYEIRRGELRPRLELQKQLSGPFWLNVQAGYRIDYSFDVDELPEGREFFRGFFGEQPFGMRNTLDNALYFNIGISFVTL
ncbi:MAG: hypothetical protein FJX97_01930 [Bacteroidetes bacterium]|nr:hypothetical protein [Bacteroidota bacterium]